MRRNLRDKGVRYLVVKKTLLKRVLDTAGIEGTVPPFDGEVALAYPSPEARTKGDGSDLIEPAKNIAAFEKKFEHAVSPLGGILESRYLSKEEVAALACVPSRHVLLGQLVMVMHAPIQQTVQALSEITRSFVSVLDQVAKSKA